MIKDILKVSIAKSKLERKKGELDKQLIFQAQDKIRGELLIIANTLGSLDPEQFSKDVVPALLQSLHDELKMELAKGNIKDEELLGLYKEMLEEKQREIVYI